MTPPRPLAALCAAAVTAAAAGIRGRLRAAQAPVQARAELSRCCRCDRWWTSFGTEHDTWCTHNRSSP